MSEWAEKAEAAKEEMETKRVGAKKKAPAKKKGEAPGKNSHRWTPDVLSVEPRPGYTPRWFKKDRAKNQLAIGWGYARPGDYEHLDKRALTIGDSPGLGATIETNNLILMEMSEEEAKSRREYFETLADSAKDDQDDAERRVGIRKLPGHGDFGANRTLH